MEHVISLWTEGSGYLSARERSTTRGGHLKVQRRQERNRKKRAHMYFFFLLRGVDDVMSENRASVSASREIGAR